MTVAANFVPRKVSAMSKGVPFFYNRGVRSGIDFKIGNCFLRAHKPSVANASGRLLPVILDPF